MLSTKENIRAILECNFAGFKDEYIEIALDRIMEIIDDAPEFKITEEQAIDKLHETGWLIKHDKEMTERPQGKWIDHWSDDLQKLGYRQCSKCKAGFQIYDHGTRKSEFPWIDGHQYTLQRICNYCPKCGTKMDKEADNEQ